MQSSHYYYLVVPLEEQGQLYLWMPPCQIGFLDDVGLDNLVIDAIFTLLLPCCSFGGAGAVVSMDGSLPNPYATLYAC
jgi:hypothetical protein